MKLSKIVYFFIVLISLIIVGNSSLFIVTEGRQAIVTQFGRPIGQPIVTAGLHFKKPFVEEVRFVDKRIMSWDGYPNQIPTRDKKYIKVDTTARWQVVNALKFIQTVQNERGAKARIDAVIDAATRDVISNHNLVEAVRNSNGILQKKREISREEIEEEVVSEIEEIKVGREQLSQMIVARADSELSDFGIRLVDVQLRRISYEKSVEAKVYERMISERERIAQKIRSIGLGEKAKIEGRQKKDLQEIEPKSYREVQRILGEAKAKSISIYAKSLSVDPKFYEFQRTMDAYKDVIGEKMNFILSSDSEFFNFLK